MKLAITKPRNTRQQPRHNTAATILPSWSVFFAKESRFYPLCNQTRYPQSARIIVVFAFSAKRTCLPGGQKKVIASTVTFSYHLFCFTNELRFLVNQILHNFSNLLRRAEVCGHIGTSHVPKYALPDDNGAEKVPRLPLRVPHPLPKTFLVTVIHIPVTLSE